MIEPDRDPAAGRPGPRARSGAGTGGDPAAGRPPSRTVNRADSEARTGVGTGGDPAAGRPPGPNRRARLGYGLAGIGAAVALAEAVPRLGLADPDHLPPATRVFATLAAETGQAPFWLAVADTLAAWAQGLAIAVVAGTACGVVIGTVPWLRDLTASTIEFLRPIPSVALIPLAILLLGTGIESTLLLIVYASFWQILVQAIAGVADADPVAVDTARSFRLSPWRRVRYLTLPSALPYLLTGVRLAASVALVLAVTAELVIGSPGLGHEIARAQTSGAVPRMYALIIVTGLLGVAVNLAARAAERRLLHWHPSIRREAAA